MGEVDRAIQVLNENGYKVLNEGKLGRILSAGALAIGSLFNQANSELITLQNFNTYLTHVDLTNDFNHKDYYDSLIENGKLIEFTKDRILKNEIFEGVTLPSIDDLDYNNFKYYYFPHNKENFILTNGKWYLEFNDKKIKYADVFYSSAGYITYNYDNDESLMSTLSYDKNGTLEGFEYNEKKDGRIFVYRAVLKNGEMKVKRYEDGNVNMTATYTDKKANGHIYIYRSNGTLIYDIPMKDNMKNGTEKAYNKNGSLAGSAEYKDDELVDFNKCTDGRIGNEYLVCPD